MSTVQITRELEVGGELVSVDIIGEYERGDSHAGFSNGGWVVQDWQSEWVNTLAQITMINNTLRGMDFSSDFEREIQDQKEAAAERRAGI